MGIPRRALEAVTGIKTFPVLASAGLGLAYGIYAAMALLSFVFVARWVQETRGRELEDMA